MQTGVRAKVDEVVLWRRLAAEFAGRAFRAATVIGSGIAASRLSPGQTGLELLENAAATAAGLFAIILMFGPVSGGHFNPVVSFADAAFGGLRWRDALAYLPAQIAGCIAGAVIANLMFASAAVSISAKDRATGPHFLSEIVATLGLVLLVFALARSGPSRVTPRRARPASSASPPQPRQPERERPNAPAHDRWERCGHQRCTARPRARSVRRRHRCRGGRLPQLLHLRHPLLRPRRGHPLAQPC